MLLPNNLSDILPGASRVQSYAGARNNFIFPLTMAITEDFRLLQVSVSCLMKWRDYLYEFHILCLLHLKINSPLYSSHLTRSSWSLLS